MTATAKAPKKEKVRKQSPEERQEALRYNQMMYGPTAGERKPPLKKVNYGASYLTHPKFQSLMAAFKNGTEYQFSVSDKGKAYVISTDGSHICFDGKIIYYCRSLNKYESSLLMDRAATLQYQTNEALVHLVFAVLKSLPELGTLLLAYAQNEFYYGADLLESGMDQQGPNLMIGTYRNGKAPAKGPAKGRF
jgi:hypothetical protein